MITLYGIRNCDTIKKARSWLTNSGIDYHFHDYRAAGLPEQLLRNWCRQLGWETLVNRRGLTWRKLPDEAKTSLNESAAIKLMLDNPALIKRPLLDTGTALHVGFKPEQYEQIFND